MGEMRNRCRLTIDLKLNVDKLTNKTSSKTKEILRHLMHLDTINEYWPLLTDMLSDLKDKQRNLEALAKDTRKDICTCKGYDLLFPEYLNSGGTIP